MAGLDPARRVSSAELNPEREVHIDSYDESENDTLVAITSLRFQLARTASRSMDAIVRPRIFSADGGASVRDAKMMIKYADQEEHT